MKKLVCEVCGGMNVKKQNGVFVCADCGIEYSLDEVKKLFVEMDEHSIVEEAKDEATISTSKNEDIIEKLKYSIDYLHFINTHQIMISSLFCLNKGEKDMNLLEMTPDSIRSLKTYRTEEIDENYISIHGLNYIYKSVYFSDDYEKYKDNYGDPQIDVKFLKRIEDFLELTPGQYRYKFIFTFNSLLEKKVVECNEVLFEAVESSIKNTIVNYLGANTLSNYSFLKIANLLKKRNLKVTLTVEKYIKKKGLLGEKTIVESTKEYNFSKFLYELIESLDKTLPVFVNPYIKEYADNIEKVRENLIDLITPYYNMRNYIGPVYDSVPEKYRTEENLLCLISLFMENRITSIGEGLNMIDTYQFRTEVKSHLDDIKKKLAELDRKMNIVGSKLYDFECGVTSVSKKLDKLTKVSKANLVVSLLQL